MFAKQLKKYKELMENPIVKAYFNGEKIEYFDDFNKWSKIDDINLDCFLDSPEKYRIAVPKQKITFTKDDVKLGGWIKDENNNVSLIIGIEDQGIWVNGDFHYFDGIENWQYSSDNGATWQPFYKVE